MGGGGGGVNREPEDSQQFLKQKNILGRHIMQPECKMTSCKDN